MQSLSFSMPERHFYDDPIWLPERDNIILQLFNVKIVPEIENSLLNCHFSHHEVLDFFYKMKWKCEKWKKNFHFVHFLTTLNTKRWIGFFTQLKSWKMNLMTFRVICGRNENSQYFRKFLFVFQLNSGECEILQKNTLERVF